MNGIKNDIGKLRYDLEQVLAAEEVVSVLTFGANKYADDNWRKLDDAHKRYYAASRRHMAAYIKGEAFDPESGYHHIAHAICCLNFMLEVELETINKTKESNET